MHSDIKQQPQPREGYKTKPDHPQTAVTKDDLDKMMQQVDPPFRAAGPANPMTDGHG